MMAMERRGPDVTRPIQAVIDGSKALRRAVLDLFDRPVIERCQLHKIRNLRVRLPRRLRSRVQAPDAAAYHADSTSAAEAELTPRGSRMCRPDARSAASVVRSDASAWRVGRPEQRLRGSQSLAAVPPVNAA